jgi:hypothetical protein
MTSFRDRAVERIEGATDHSPWPFDEASFCSNEALLVYA